MLSTVNQIGGAAGIAALGTLFFSRLDRSAAGAPSLASYADALGALLGWQVALYVVAAMLMALAPRPRA